LSQKTSSDTGHVLAAYAEAYIAGRSVLFVGDVDSGVPTRLLQLGARSVNAYDPDAARARAAAPRAPRAIVVRPLPHTFEIRDGAFDAAIVPDMTASPDPDKLARELARLVTADGLVLAATANADATGDTTRAIPYESFYDMFAVCFGFVRVAAEIPWRGVALAELGQDGEPAVTVDSQLAPEAPTPTHFVIAASHQPADVDAYALFQLPGEDDDYADDAREIARLGRMADEEAREIDANERRISVQAAASARADVTAAMAAELAEARLRADVLGSQLSEARAQSSRLESFEQHLRDEREKNLRQADEVARAASTLAAAEQRISAAEAHLALAQKGAREEVAQAEKAARAQVSAAEKRAAERLRQLEQAVEKSAEEHAHELAQAEARLRERAAVVADLEREVARRERIVRELVMSLEAQAGTAAQAASPVAASVSPAAVEPADPELQAKVRAMALEIARYEGELLAREWRIAELEQNLAIAESAAMLPDPAGARANVQPSAAPVPNADGSRIAELETEIDTLRRALAQEHEEKKRIESGQGVDELRAALAEKMALIEQMSTTGRTAGPDADAR
jgi:hypothetical protein